MGRFVLRPEAVSDIDEIWEYSVRHWGVTRANRYVGEIRSVIEKVAKNPKLGRAFSNRRPDHLRALVGSQAVVYRVLDEQIDIVRVLHQRMDLPRYLWLTPLAPA